jgi:hypothetical protein
LVFIDKYVPGANISDTNLVYAYAAAQTMVQVLQQCSDSLTRENVMKPTASLRDFSPDMALKVCFLGAVRRRTFICCRNIQISTSSAVRDRNRSATIQTMSLTRSLIPQEHRPILDQLLVRLSLRQGQG